MELPSELAADLRILTEALDPPRADLEVELHALIADIRLTTRSYLGLTLTIVSAGIPFTIIAVDEPIEPGRIRSSALLPLTTLCDVEPESSMIFYAAEPNAFIHFATEVSNALGLDGGAIELDTRLTLPSRTDALSAIAAARQVNQAIGVLIERGRSPAAARGELAALAERAGTVLEVAATDLLDGESPATTPGAKPAAHHDRLERED
ncbi:MAG: hypothetical protein QOF92_1778 [Pseudonocardiales bacterium]|nr:hypothetical protein [Pseudonocardiales bacterium]